jgi:hypothetical protein
MTEPIEDMEEHRRDCAGAMACCVWGLGAALVGFCLALWLCIRLRGGA